jgi:hypothetical protein
MGNTAASKARCFCVLFVVHLVHILLRTATLSLLAATRGWFAAVYLVGDFLVLVGYKALRRALPVLDATRRRAKLAAYSVPREGRRR